MSDGPELSRRRFLQGTGGAALAGGTAGLLAGCADGRPDGPGSDAHRYLPFRGTHQTGITAVHQPSSLMAAFTVTAADRSELRDLFVTLTEESERLMSGTAYEDRDPAYPALHTGHLGNPPPPADLSITVSVGASLFDDRFGLADRRPVELVRMPFLANDRLDPDRSHGDLLVSIASASPDVDLFALRQLMRVTRGELVLDWMLDGYTRRVEAGPGEAGVRNLMGFVDGTANLHPDDPASMDRFVWVADGDGEPAWAVGGSYHVVRVIRMFVEFWDRTRLSEQEALIGRRRSNGAPLDGEVETDVPDFAADPDGAVTPLDAHIRLANPRTPETADQLLLRKGFSFSRGSTGPATSTRAWPSCRSSAAWSASSSRSRPAWRGSRWRSTSSPSAAASSSPSPAPATASTWPSASSRDGARTSVGQAAGGWLALAGAVSRARPSLRRPAAVASGSRAGSAKPV